MCCSRLRSPTLLIFSLIKSGKTGFETFEMVKEALISIAFSRKEEYRLKVMPSTRKNAETVEKLRSLVKADRRLTIGEICDEVGISVGSCQANLTLE